MRLFLPFLMVLVIGAGIGYWYWTTTPQYSIGQVKDAIKAHDLQKFENYVDLDVVSTRLVDDFLTEPMQRTAGQSSIGDLIITGLMAVFKPKMVMSVKQQLIDYVQSGAFTNVRDPDQSSSKVDLKKMDSRFGFQKHAFKGIRSVKTDGNLSTLELRFYNATYDQDLILEVKMRKGEDNHWHVIELSNLPDFMAKLAQLEAGRKQGSLPQLRILALSTRHVHGL